MISRNIVNNSQVYLILKHYHLPGSEEEHLDSSD